MFAICTNDQIAVSNGWRLPTLNVERCASHVPRPLSVVRTWRLRVGR